MKQGLEFGYYWDDFNKRWWPYTKKKDLKLNNKKETIKEENR